MKKATQDLKKSKNYLGLVILSALFSFNLGYASTPAATPAAIPAVTAAANLNNNPELILQTTISDLQQEINQNQAALAKDPGELNNLVTKHLLPIIYIERMAAMTLGPKWRTANDAQQQAFVKQFSLLLTRSYSRALLQMGDYKIVVFPIRGEAWKKLGYVAIAGQLQPRNGGTASSVTYYMERDQGVWKIYDFALEGVSFAKNFRAQFDQFSDIQSLIIKLTELNKAMSTAMATGPNPATASVIRPNTNWL